MAVLDVITYPDDRLKRTSAPVELFDQRVVRLASDLKETMRASPGSVGIAAPQVGVLSRVAIVDVSGRRKVTSHGILVLVNPEVESWEGLEVGREGCMSVPDYTGNVIRPQAISLTYQDETGTSHTLATEGFEARAIQHEIDHLDGLLFLDRLFSRHHDLFRRKVRG